MLFTSLKILGVPEVDYSAGELIIQEGKPGGKVYVLISGTVEIYKSGEKVGETSAKGAMFGEMAVILSQNNSATVRSYTGSRFFEIKNMQAFLHDNPDEALEVMQTMCSRIKTLNEQVAEFKRAN